MKRELLIIAIFFILSLTLLSCVYASDVNETAVVDDSVIVESNVDCEDEIADANLCSQGNVIDYDENHVVDSVINDNYTISLGDINNYELSAEEFDFGIENYETSVKVGECLDIEGCEMQIDVFSDCKFCDMNFESDEELILDAIFNNDVSISSWIGVNVSLDNVSCFEIFLFKMEDFVSGSFEEGKFKNSFAINHELIVYILHDGNLENYLDCIVIVCANKVMDDFAYSINNSIVGDESNVYFNSYFIHLFFNTKFSIFNNAPTVSTFQSFNDHIFYEMTLNFKNSELFTNDEVYLLKKVI